MLGKSCCKKKKMDIAWTASHFLRMKMTTATLFWDDSLTAVYIQVHMNTVSALDPFGVVGPASLIEEPLNRLRHDLESRVLRPAKPAAA